MKNNIFSKIIPFIFPAKCIFCGNFISDTPLRICNDCFDKLRFNTNYCHMCGEPLDTVYGDNKCISCKNKRKPYSRVFVPLIYKDKVRRAIINFKYNGRISYAKTFAILIFTELKNAGYIPDAITFVPIHFLRRIRRGYNQTELIAQELSHLFSVPLIDTLKKSHYTQKLSNITVEKRRQTVKNSFVPKAKALPMQINNILLVDDIITTSSTLTECSRIIKNEYGCNISVAAIASASKAKL